MAETEITKADDPGSAPFQTFDAEDDRQVLAEIRGDNTEVLSKLVYSYADRRGNTINGLSLAGVRETVRAMNRNGIARIRITPTPPIITENEDYIDVMVYAEDQLNGNGAWGTKRQSKSVGNYANPFAKEMALSKAQRNAMFALIPATHVAAMIAEYLGDQNRTSKLGTKKVPQIAAPDDSLLHDHNWARLFERAQQEKGLDQERVMARLGFPEDKRGFVAKFRNYSIDGVMAELEKPVEGEVVTDSVLG